MPYRQKIDVLHLIGSLSPGGAERNLYYLAESMAASRLRYGICCLVDRGEFADEIEGPRLPVFDLKFRRRYFLRTVLRLRKLLKQRGVRVLHTHLYDPGVIGRIAAWLAGVPVVITHEHGKTLWKKWYHRAFERLAVGRTDLRIAVSQDIMNLRIRTESTPPEKIRLVYNAVDPEHLDVDENVRKKTRVDLGIDGFKVVGTVGRLVDAKSYDLLLEVAREVCDEKPGVRFVLAGAGPLEGKLLEKREALGLSEQFLFLGQRRDIPELLAAIDLYVISSKREGLPISLIEAMMAGKPVVSTAVGGIPDTLTQACDGVLVEPGDRGALTRAIVDLIDNRSRMDILGRNARKRAIERYAPDRILAELETIYEELLGRKGLAFKVSEEAEPGAGPRTG
jgi:glycosyltransferase involved in cell wall biosynthesis